MRFPLVRLALGALSVAACGCAHAHAEPLSPVSAAPTILVGRSCPKLRADREPGAPSFQRAFVETADVSGTAARVSPEVLASTPVTLRTVNNTLVTQDTVSSVPWEPCATPDCASRHHWLLNVNPHLPTRTDEPVRLALQLSPVEGSSTAPASVTVEAFDQRPAVVELPSPEGGAAVVAVTPYLLGTDADIAALYECKRAWAQQRGGAGEARE